MATFITGRDQEFYKELQKLLKIPDNCRRVVFEMAYNEVATVTFEVIAEKGTGEPIIEQYMLTKIEDSE